MKASTAILLGFTSLTLFANLLILESIKGRDWKEIAAALVTLSLAMVCISSFCAEGDVDKRTGIFGIGASGLLFVGGLICLIEAF